MIKAVEANMKGKGTTPEPEALLREMWDRQPACGVVSSGSLPDYIH
jgi:hypothetical protein